MADPIYLDYNATAPVDPAVVAAMRPYLEKRFGNASSAHEYGYEAREGVEASRSNVASLIGASADDIIFTGGGSETNNLAIKGAVFACLDKRPHIISSVVEHPAVLNTLHYLHRRFGVESTLVPVDQSGTVSPDAIREALRPETVLVTIMHANNEVGTIQPLARIGEITHAAGVLFHVDAAQSVGKLPVDVTELGIDLLTIAAHKLYGPKGVGALYLRSGVQIDPLIHGSSQEHGMRAGTENVAGIVGLGVAAGIATHDIREEETRLRSLRDRLHRLLGEGVRGTELNGHPVDRLPNTLNISLPHAVGQAVLVYAPEVAASTGSACHSAAVEPSPVLLAMGLSRERALGALRLSLGRWSTEEEMDRASEALVTAYEAVALIPAS
ncbi:MAG: cysteine desulfurase family protein [Chloroflexota bacterium]|nr:MAG: cysteine desulfurase NifS [Chloroflexota bacterium]